MDKMNKKILLRCLDAGQLALKIMNFSENIDENKTDDDIEYLMDKFIELGELLGEASNMIALDTQILNEMISSKDKE